MITLCPHTQITQRNVPIEVHDLHEELKGYTISSASFTTCGVCGVSFYDDNALNGVRVPLQQQTPSVQQT